MQRTICPKCSHDSSTKAGIINGRQRYKCRNCGYHFTINKVGKRIDQYYVTKALQLYLEGLSYREIERIIGVSHVSVMNWVKQYGIKRVETGQYHPNYRIVSHEELASYFSDKSEVQGKGMLITELGDKFMVIRWERFRE
ncbi:IS1/IS1595 family N-terminal zinc-binding domain-containing protein [Sanyastnella coralliicola]|uniref:IS1/IS1595 family N-terminal zinc-binding domain-containing protein n=1 Tax=Sanyastnella coralliicola TaxID=3069118 RepID=UPI003313073A